MELLSFYSYIMWHETTRIAPTTGEASPTGYPVTEKGHDCVGNRPLDRRIEEFCRTMARRIPAQRSKSTSPKANSGTAIPIDFPTETRTGPDASAGSTGGGVRN